MAGRTYGPGDAIAIRDVISRAIPQAERRYTEREWETEGGNALFTHQIAPWLSVADQDSLPRVVRAAQIWIARIHKEHPRYPESGLLGWTIGGMPICQRCSTGVHASSDGPLDGTQYWPCPVWDSAERTSDALAALSPEILSRVVPLSEGG